MVVVVDIALILTLSIATTLGATHSFDQAALALPIFFLFLFLPTLVGDWLDIEDLIFTSKPRFPPPFPADPQHSFLPRRDLRRRC